MTHHRACGYPELFYWYSSAATMPLNVRRRVRRRSAVQRAERQKMAEEAPVEGGDFGRAEQIVQGVDFLRIRCGGHWYRSLDVTAGVRAYQNKNGKTVRFWHGFYNAKMIDHFTGAPLVIGLYSASKQEFDCYPDMLDRLEAVLDGRPKAMVADRGYSVRKLFALNTGRTASGLRGSACT